MAYEIDAIDRRILMLLQQNAKATIKEMAEKLQMSTTPVFDRIKKMEHEGYIKAYKAVLDYERLSFDHVVFCSVSLERHNKEYLEQFVEDVKSLPQVMECYHVSGLHDYLLKVVVKDMKAYQSFITNELASLPNIGRVQSSFVMTTIKDEDILTLH